MSEFSIINIYDNLMNIRLSYAKRVKFCKDEMYKLKLDYGNAQMHDKEYFKRLCPLNIERNNINVEYKIRLFKYIQTVPSVYLVENMINDFNNNLL